MLLKAKPTSTKVEKFGSVQVRMRVEPQDLGRKGGLDKYLPSVALSGDTLWTHSSVVFTPLLR